MVWKLILWEKYLKQGFCNKRFYKGVPVECGFEISWHVNENVYQ